ncbi:YceK/YidQ family lipoprotein [Candidatus Uabimicrobium helgolandensis]
MRKIILYIFIISLCGCGTITNLKRPVLFKTDYDTPEKGIAYYGGVGFDIDMLEENIALGVIDMPFSFVFDTLTLPAVFFIKSSAQFTEYERETVPPQSVPSY